MARKNKTTNAGSELGKAKLLDEAADIKLKAAEKMSRAKAILGDDDDEDDDAPELRPTFARPEPMLEPLPEPAEAPLSNFEAALADLNGRGRFEVFKLSMTGKRVKVGSYGLDEYPERMDNIAQEHGGGSFRILLKDERGQYVCSTTEDYDTKSYGGGKPAEPAATTSIDRLMERMDAREADHRREMEMMRLENQKLMLTMVEKMSAPRQETNLIDAIKLVKELQGEQRSPMDSFREVLELANSVKEETGLAEPEHPLVAAIDKVMKVASPLLTAWVSKVAAPPLASGVRTAPAKALPASTGKPDNTPAVIPATPGETPSLEAGTPVEEQPVVVDPRLKTYAESLLAQASAGNEVERVGDTIINLTPDDSLDELYTMVTHPGFVGHLLAAEPRLIPHQVWLANLTVYIKKELDEAEAENAEAPIEAAASTDAPAPAPEPAPAS